MEKIKILSILTLLLLLSCKKEKLPEPSQTGAGIVACKINGKVWLADPGSSFNGKKFSLLYDNLYKPKRRFVLYANRIADNDNSNLMLAVSDVKTTGTQNFAFDTSPYPDNPHYMNHGAYYQNKPNQENYITNSRYTGSITFTRVDTVSRILAGTFEFTAENKYGSGETVKVTDGRFDIKYGQ